MSGAAYCTMQAWARFKILPSPLHLTKSSGVFSLIPFKYRSAPARFFPLKVKMNEICGAVWD
jgi:hypothetical protein